MNALALAVLLLAAHLADNWMRRRRDARLPVPLPCLSYRRARTYRNN